MRGCGRWQYRKGRSGCESPCSSCPGLIRAPIPFRRHRGVDSRVKPENDEEGEVCSHQVASDTARAGTFPACPMTEEVAVSHGVGGGGKDGEDQFSLSFGAILI